MQTEIQKEASPFIRALTEAVVQVDRFELEPEERERTLCDTARFVQQSVDALGLYLSFLFGFGMFGFRGFCLVRYGQTFVDMNAADRQDLVESWAYGSVGLRRKLFRLVRSTALLAFYEMPPIQQALEKMNPS